MNVSVGNEFCDIDAFEDTRTIAAAEAQLRAAVAARRHFYLGVGLHKPHLPWQAAPEDWAQHPAGEMNPPLLIALPLRILASRLCSNRLGKPAPIDGIEVS